MQQHAKNVIIFLIPPEPIINGGVLSIFSICSVSRQFKDIHHSEVYIATYPGSKSYKRNTLFENDETIYSFDELFRGTPPDSLLLHVPEYASDKVYSSLQKHTAKLRKVKRLQINILNQNIWMMPEPLIIAKWFSLTPNVTQTLAHKKYATQELADTYNLPTKHLSIYMDPSQYKKIAFEEKRNIIALSPDITDKREQIVKELEQNLPDYEIITIKDMKYEDYKQLISSAKFAITFGEGFDNYYFEAFLSGGIAFAVYNESFFPDKDFAGFSNIFASYEAMLAGIVDRINKLDNEKDYADTVSKSFDKVSELYSFRRYTQNIKDFYLGDFTYTPAPHSAELLMGAVLRTYSEQIAKQADIISQLDKRVIDQEALITEKGVAIDELDSQILELKSSRSWKVTKPLRRVSSAVEKKK